MTAQLPLIPYVRQSRAKERTISIEEQVRDIKAWAERAGVQLTKPVVEQGVSGSKHWRKRELGEAIARCERREADGIIVAYQSRLSRESGLGTAEVWEALDRASARLVCVYENIDTARDDDQEFNFGIQALIARQEWKRHRRNWLKGRRNATERGVHIGPAPAGYSPAVLGYENGKPVHGPLEPNEHAPAVVAAFECRAAGGSWTEVARVLTNACVPTSRGSTRWSLNGAAKLLRNEAYLGVARSGEFRNEEAHAALVTRALFMAVQSRRERRAIVRSNTATTPAEPRLLAGLLRCASCGHRMTLDWLKRPNGERYPFYRCRNSGACTQRVSIGACKIERALEETLREVLAAEEFTIHTDLTEAESLRAEYAAAREVWQAHIESDPTQAPESWNARAVFLEARMAEARKALDAAEIAEPLPSIEVYDELTVSLRREVMAAWLESAAKSGLGWLAVKPGGGDRRFTFLPVAA